MTQKSKMNLWETYSDKSYYFPRLHQAMVAILEKKLNGASEKEEVITHFCQKQGGQVLSSSEDFNFLLELFNAFVDGVLWQLSRMPPQLTTER